MSRIEYFIFCIGLVLISEHVAARRTSKVEPRYDKSLQTYIYEPTFDDEYQADATTMFPPLIESTNPTIVSESIPDAVIPTRAVSNVAIPDASVPDVSVPEVAAPDISVDAPVIPPPPPPKSQEEILQKLPDALYTGPYYPQSNSYPNSYYPGYPWQYLTQPQYVQPNGQQMPNSYSQPNGQSMPSNYFQMQPEFEGVLVPVQTLTPNSANTQILPQQSQQILQITKPTNPAHNKNSENKITPVANRNSLDLALILQALLPPGVISFIIAVGTFILNSFSTIAFAGVITSLLCSLTPLCSISFGTLPIGFRQMIISEGSTIKRVRRAAEAVSDALEKYEKIQRSVESLTNSLKKVQQSSQH